MDENRPNAESEFLPATFSLRTLFLILTTCGVFFAVLRVADGVWACCGTAGFLTVWFAITEQRGRAQLAGIAMILSFLSAGLKPINSDRDGHRAQCMNNLKQIGLALLAYEQQHGSFPPEYVADANGKPLLSWRALILPQMDNLNLARQIRSDEAWNGPNNAKVTNSALAGFQWLRCPSEPYSKSVSTQTSYVAVVGPHTAWSGATPRKLSEFKNPSGTILVIEIAHSGIQWAEPRDLYIGQMPMSVNPKVGQGISSDHADGVNAVFVDGSVHFIPNSINPKTLAELLDLDGCSDPSAYR